MSVAPIRAGELVALITSAVDSGWFFNATNVAPAPTLRLTASNKSYAASVPRVSGSRFITRVR